jgi:hypothetical protein
MTLCVTCEDGGGGGGGGSSVSSGVDNIHIYCILWPCACLTRRYHIQEHKLHLHCQKTLNLRIKIYNWLKTHKTNLHISYCTNLHVVVFLGFRDKPRMYYSLAGLLYRPILTFQVRPPDASAPADASRTLVAEVGTLWAGK